MPFSFAIAHLQVAKVTDAATGLTVDIVGSADEVVELVRPVWARVSPFWPLWAGRAWPCIVTGCCNCLLLPALSIGRCGADLRFLRPFLTFQAFSGGVAGTAVFTTVCRIGSAGTATASFDGSVAKC